MKRAFTKFGLILFYLIICLCAFSVNAQKKIEHTHKIVFVYFEKYEKNYIVIPNFGKLYSFKIYRKLKNESDYQFMIEKRRPSIQVRSNWPGTRSVHWKDPDYHSRDIDYQIFAFDKLGNELCEMEIIWEKDKNE